MGRRAHSRRLDLWMNGEAVGTWVLSPHREELVYADSWLASPAARPLSLSLPLRPGTPYKGAVVSAWFENLLPDSKPIRERLARQFKAESTSAFDLLEQIGRDCVGALQILPAGQDPGAATIKGERLDEAGVARLLRAAVTPPTGHYGAPADEVIDLRISIAGAQEKTALLRKDGEWYRPVGATPTTHILKLPLGVIGGGLDIDMSGSVENEWLCSRILRAYGLAVAHCEMASFEGQRVLVVKRFDRRLVDGGKWLARLPQEDMCQALGVEPLRKYESDGGPGIEAILNLLNGSREADRDRTTFFETQLLFWLLRAPDGHAKNFSVHLLAQGAYSLTPLYDVLSALPVLGTRRGQISPTKIKVAMAIKGKNTHWKMAEIQRRHWNAVARRCGVGSSAEPIIERLLAATPGVIETVRAELPAGFPPAIAEPILQGLATNAEQLARMPTN